MKLVKAIHVIRRRNPDTQEREEIRPGKVFSIDESSKEYRSLKASNAIADPDEITRADVLPAAPPAAPSMPGTAQARMAATDTGDKINTGNVAREATKIGGLTNAEFDAFVEDATKDQLLVYASEAGCEVNPKDRKSDMIEVLRSHRQRESLL